MCVYVHLKRVGSSIKRRLFVKKHHNQLLCKEKINISDRNNNIDKQTGLEFEEKVGQQQVVNN